MEEERSPPPLKNCYWVLRHGRSVPNEIGLIVSHKSNGTLPQHGLAEGGFVQAKAAGEIFLKQLEEHGSFKNVAICSSPFTRTMETANCVAEVLKRAYENLEIKVLDELRERYFGPALELQSHLHYAEIWEIDARNPLVGPEGGESVADVAKRVAAVIPQLELQHEGYAILLVSHGDTLQILQTITKAAEVSRIKTDSEEYVSILSQHRKFALLTGELRRLA
ncbi:hypothetical protein SELMODRAFT_85568 [Selaginella moellendorffii]|uniref:Phosphoglycerate mutase family protein n=1 Tax=Selaginella moellendorffii TaxID=88036 RepID=D8R514_SELML|nr:metal-independent phosphoserine phosphatase isoform X1 [Selaginella moellendorffii]EFJ32765.1 hypothetical protein SELMODRAFT_85568 [Selaginella moellendorffii]|eukprot:XP_002966738.1 metal-independent phosphoserine phosphatase isoform X1 [Selaginella moellendorffii]